MKKRIRSTLAAAMLGIGMMLSFGTGSAAWAAAEDLPVNADNQAYWREMLQKYRVDDEVGQVMLVRCNMPPPKSTLLRMSMSSCSK